MAPEDVAVEAGWKMFLGRIDVRIRNVRLVRIDEIHKSEERRARTTKLLEKNRQEAIGREIDHCTRVRRSPATEHRQPEIDSGHVGIGIENGSGADVARRPEIREAGEDWHLFSAD